MNVLKTAIEGVEKLNEGYTFWSLCVWMAEQPGGYVIIRPDFIGVAQAEGDTLHIWIAVGEDGVRKAVELAPPGIREVTWRRGLCENKDDIHRWPMERIKRFFQNGRTDQHSRETKDPERIDDPACNTHATA